MSLVLQCLHLEVFPKGEFANTAREEVELKLEVDPLRMKEAVDAMAKELSPVHSDKDVKSYAPELISEISAMINQHYNHEDNLSHLIKQFSKKGI